MNICLSLLFVSRYHTVMVLEIGLPILNGIYFVILNEKIFRCKYFIRGIQFLNVDILFDHAFTVVRLAAGFELELDVSDDHVLGDGLGHVIHGE